MSTPESAQAPRADVDRIEAEIVKHRTELGRTVDELGERLDIKKRSKRRWDQAKRSIENTAAVAKDNIQLALLRARNSPQRQWVPILIPVLGIVAGIVLIVVVRTKKP